MSKEVDILRSKFLKIFPNIPEQIRSESIIAVVDNNPYTWNVAMDKTILTDVGADAKSGDVVMGYITTHDYFDTLDTEVFVFDIHYDAVSGFVQKLAYPSTMTGQILADDTEPMVLGLDSLVIEFDGGNGTWSAPGFEAPIVVTGLFAFAAIVVIRRRK